MCSLWVRRTACSTCDDEDFPAYVKLAEFSVSHWLSSLVRSSLFGVGEAALERGDAGEGLRTLGWGEGEATGEHAWAESRHFWVSIGCCMGCKWVGKGRVSRVNVEDRKSTV